MREKRMPLPPHAIQTPRMFIPCRDRGRAALDFHTEESPAGDGAVSDYRVIQPWESVVCGLASHNAVSGPQGKALMGSRVAFA